MSLAHVFCMRSRTAQTAAPRPSPRAALAGASALLALPPGARLLDAGCGLGHGLAALRTEFPQARIDGIEWSWPLRLAAGLRCRWAGVPIANYGMTIAFTLGIFDRALEPFPDALETWRHILLR